MTSHSAITIRVSLEMQDIAKRLSADIDKAAGEHLAFTLIVYTPGRASYVSNAARADSVREIKNLLELWENGMPDTPAHEIQ